MTCEPEKVTGFVDGALEPAEQARLEEHLRGCPSCLAQADGERELRRRLALLERPRPAELLEPRVRKALRPRRRAWRWALPLAASLVLALSWAHGAPAVLGWQLAYDHEHCFGKPRLPARVWTGDPAQMGAWLEDEGARAPLLPPGAAGLELVGGRRCPLADRRVAHVYYVGGEQELSLYLVPGWVRLGRTETLRRGDKTVRLMRVAGSTVGLVSRSPEAVEGFSRALTTTVALARPAR